MIKFLIDSLIDESMSMKDIWEMKSKNKCEKKTIGKSQCDLCKKNFLSEQGLKHHKTMQ